MAKFVRKAGSTSNILYLFIQDSSSTTGAGLGSLDNTSGIAGGYVREGATGVALALDEAITTPGTYQAPSTAAHARIGTPANLRTGDYEIHFHNDLFATGADSVFLSLGGATNMAELRLEIQLDANTAEDVYARVGAPAGASVSADVASVTTDVANVYSRIGAPAGASVSADVASVSTDVANVSTLIGTPAGASVSADVASVSTDVANVSTLIGTPAGASIAADIADKTGYELSDAGVDAIHDEIVDGTLTLRQSTRLQNSAMFGRSTGSGTTNPKFRDVGNTIDRISATLDANKNRSSVTLDAS